MSYEPKGKVKTFIDAMTAQPEKSSWTANEVAAVMGIAQSSVSAYLDAPIRHQAIYRSMVDGRILYSLKPLPVVVIDVESPKPGSLPLWKPPQMMAPRGEQRVIAPAAAPAPAEASMPEDAGAEPEHRAQASPLVAAPPHVDPDAGSTEEEPLDEVVPFAAALWTDGDLLLYGTVETEDGGRLIRAADVHKLRRLLHGQAE